MIIIAVHKFGLFSPPSKTMSERIHVDECKDSLVMEKAHKESGICSDVKSAVFQPFLLAEQSLPSNARIAVHNELHSHSSSQQPWRNVQPCLSLADSELLESRRIFLITACYEIKYKWIRKDYCERGLHSVVRCFEKCSFVAPPAHKKFKTLLVLEDTQIQVIIQLPIHKNRMHYVFIATGCI